jgi:hypothetical protein
MRPAEVRPAEVRPAEVRMGDVVLLTPRIPGNHPLHQLRDVIVVRHASSSTRLPAARHHLVRLLLEIDVGERLPVGVADDEAGVVALVDGPGVTGSGVRAWNDDTISGMCRV